MRPYSRRIHLGNIGEQGWVVVGILAPLFIFSYMIRLSTGVLGPMLMADLAISARELGLLAGAFFYAFGLALLPVGMALDSFGPKRIIMSTTLVAVVGCLLSWTAGGFTSLLVGRILLGLGMSSVLMGSLKIFTNWFRPDRFAFLAGLMLSLGNLGGLVAATPLLLMADFFGWRDCFGYFSLFVLLMILLIFFFVSDHPPGRRAQVALDHQTNRLRRRDALPALKAIYGSPHLLIIGLSSYVRYGSLITIQGFLGMLYLVDIVKCGPEKAGNILGMVSIGYLIGSPLAGRLSDTVVRSRKKVVVPGFFLFSLVMIPFLLETHLHIAWWYLIFGAIGLFSATSAVNFAHAKELFPAKISGTVLTSTNLFVMLGAASGSQISGAILGMYPQTATGYSFQAYQVVILCLACASFLAGLLYLLVKDTGSHQAR
ncbi:MAG: MFS transporter [Pseudomonadota bacterium]